jgi:6-phosphogluconolactonase/glucosamine-6-phosphate isomerase/deaminase
MKYRMFNTVEDLMDKAYALLLYHLELTCIEPHAVLLPGGATPLPLYDRAANRNIGINSSLHLIMTDERHVPFESEQNNYSKMSGMIKNIGIPESRVLNVNTSLDLNAAASNYNEDIEQFIAGGGRITMGFLGLGKDGHTASLFNEKDAAEKKKYAIAVPQKEQPSRISVTHDLIIKTEHLVFLAAGAKKKNIVAAMKKIPDNIVAGQAVKGVKNVELWYTY